LTWRDWHEAETFHDSLRLLCGHCGTAEESPGGTKESAGVEVGATKQDHGGPALMDHFNIKTTEMRAVAFTSAPMKERGIWLTLMLHCVATEKAVIESCRNWPEKNWLSVLGVSKADVIKGGSMWEWVNDDLMVWNFPHHHLKVLAVKRAQGPKGKDGGRPKNGNPDGFPTRLSHDHTHAETLKDKVIERENKEKEREYAHTLPDSSSISSTEYEPEKKEGGAGVPVTVEEALAYAESYSKGNAEMLIIEDVSVRNWFDDRCSCGWQPVRSGMQVPIPDWRADLRKWAREDKRRNGYATVPAAKKEKAVPVEVEPEGWWDAWPELWPGVPLPTNWHGIPESWKSDLRIKIDDMKL